MRLGGVTACPLAWWPIVCPEESLRFSPSLSSKLFTPFRYILFACTIALIPRGISFTASFSHAKWFLTEISPRYRNPRKNCRSSDGSGVNVPSRSKNAATPSHFFAPLIMQLPALRPLLRALFLCFPRNISSLPPAPASRAPSRMRRSARSTSALPFESSCGHSRQGCP